MIDTKRFLSNIKCKHITITLAILFILYHIHRSSNPTTIPTNNMQQEPLAPVKKLKKHNPVRKEELNKNVHIFYYAWYKNKEKDGDYQRWYLKGEVLASKFLPTFGLYSSRDETVIDRHMSMIKESGVGVVVVGWVPPNHREAPNWSMIMAAAAKHDLKVTLQILDYENRNVENLKVHLHDFFQKYRFHQAFYKVKTNGILQPMIYVQYVHKILYPEWQKLFDRNGLLSVRGSFMDGLYIGTLTTFDDHDHIIDSGFDGFYTYSARNGESYGSTYSSFRYFQEFADIHSLIFIPTIGPGHDNTKINPSNDNHPVARKDGKYYTNGWFQVLVSRARYVSINSFNDWGEGTQIEPAAPRRDSEHEDYGERGENGYLSMTKEWVDRLTERWYQRSLV